ncbi:hypothetical protein [Neptunicoccus sediminis]|uniref:hypothetical protein n=1 Tax=Neptunicoccus sediminis TaxID=1892596 RepID=UPI0012FFBFA9|nr:hypothetical protein [Neptunicoccus sediminis]
MKEKTKLKSLVISAYTILAINLAIFAKPSLESVIFPVVSEIETVESTNIDADLQRVFVRFKKYRDCDFVGLRMSDPLGYRVKFEFLDQHGGDSYHSRPAGVNVAGPWLVYSSYPLEEMKIEAIHFCDGLFGRKNKVTSVMNDGK